MFNLLARGEISLEISPTCTLILDFQLPEPWENNFLLFKPLSLWLSVKAISADWRTDVVLSNEQITLTCIVWKIFGESVSCSVVTNSLQLWTVARHDPLSMESPDKNISGILGKGYHSLLQGISMIQDWTWVSCIAGRFFNMGATGKWKSLSHVWLFATPWTTGVGSRSLLQETFPTQG